MLTRAVGVLDPDYPDNSGGLDTWCLQHLDLDVDDTYDYLRSERPDYVTFERWILDRRGGHLHEAKIARFNQIVLHRQHIRPHKIIETYADIGFDPDVDTCTSALLLNTLQDWHRFRNVDLQSETSDIPSNMAPLVGSIEVGPLNVMQLPRTWHKVLLEAKGLLNSDYPACGNGLDLNVLTTLGLDRDETVEYLRQALPVYLEFERWVVERIGGVDRLKVNAFQTSMLNREHPEPKRSLIHQLTGCDRTITNGVLLNHLEDWRYAYDLAIRP